MKNSQYLKRAVIAIMFLITLVVTTWAVLVLADPQTSRTIHIAAIVLLLASVIVGVLVMLWADKMKTIYRAEYDGSIMELINIDNENDRLFDARGEFQHGECVRSDELVIVKDPTIIEGLSVRSAHRKATVVRIS